jgi:hypothetical protein
MHTGAKGRAEIPGEKWCVKRHGAAHGRKGRKRAAAAEEKAIETKERQAGKKACKEYASC